MAKTVFLHYTQEELDRNFDQRGWVSNALEIIGRYPVLSRATRERLARRTFAFGATPDEVLDVFPAARSPAPVQIFVHGGAWKNFTKDDFSFVADALVPAGIHAVILNFSNLPAVRLPDMAEQVQRAFEWVHGQAATFGGDPQRLYVSAHSSGAHLAALALQRCDVVRAATLVSGPYYLEPVVLSARSSYVHLSREEVLALSPGLHAGRMRCPVMVGYAEHDTDEFQRQSRQFAASLQDAGRLQKLERFTGVNHFELMERFGDAGHPLVRGILEQM